MAKPSILLIGCGNMGRALLGGWEKQKTFSELAIVDPHVPDELKKKYTAYADISEVKRDFDAVILAIKPQSFGDVLPFLKPLVLPETFFLSIAAGKSLDTIMAYTGEESAVIRAMPNTPALIGQGMSVCVPNANVTDVQRSIVSDLLSAVGDVVWIEDERHMHAVTALSGSGPAYVYALTEAMQRAGVALGLSPELADRLARKTAQGAAALAESSEESLEQLRRNVTSPGGTTEAALHVLLGENGLDSLLKRALAAASQRSEELSS